MTTADELKARFQFHPADGLAQARHEEIREACLFVALEFNNWLPESREKSLALTALQEAMMWGNAAVAIYGSAQEGTNLCGICRLGFSNEYPRSAVNPSVHSADGHPPF